jgi:hypothetical protein
VEYYVYLLPVCCLNLLYGNRMFLSPPPQKTLKLTYSNVEFQKFSGCNNPGLPFGRKGGKGGKGKVGGENMLQGLGGG